MTRPLRHLLWLLVLAGLGGAPNSAQTPVPRPAPAALPPVARPVRLPAPVTASAQPAPTPLAQSTQAAAEPQDMGASQTLAASLSALSAALEARLAAAAPTVQGRPYDNPHTDDTHLVLSHYNVAGASSGLQDDGRGACGTVAGYTKDILDQASRGVDGEVLDAGDLTSYGYTQSILNNLTAADAYDATAAALAGNGQGVTRFREALCPDYSNAALESPAGITATANFFVQCARHPSYLTYQGRPVLFAYAGDGAIPGMTGAATVARIYAPLLAQIRAQGVNVLFDPDWGGTGGSTALSELQAVGAEGGWQFSGGGSPLALDSPVPGIEGYIDAIRGADSAGGRPYLTMYAGYLSGRWNPSGVGGHWYNEYCGGKGMEAQFASVLALDPAWVQIETYNDAGEGGAWSNNIHLCYPDPNGRNYPPHTDAPDFYPTTAGFGDELSYWIRWYKTGRRPVIAVNHLDVYSRTQLASASEHPTADPYPGVSTVDNPAGSPAGLQDAVNVTVFARSACQVRVSGVTPSPAVLVAPAGVSHLTFPVTQAGTPLAEMLVGGQVVQQVYGHPIAAAAALTDLNVASCSSVPGVKFVLAVPRPAGLSVDRVGIFLRSTSLTGKALSVQGLSATDLAAAPPAPFVGSSFNDPAGIGETLDLAALPGQDALAQAVNGYGHGLMTLSADPLGAALQPVPFIADAPNTNNAYDVPGRPIPSGHIIASCPVISTSADPNADGQAGLALLSSRANGYFGSGILAFLSKYGGQYTLILKYEDSVLGDSLSTGNPTLATLPVNAMAPGEVGTLALEDDGTDLTLTYTPGDQQH